MTEEEKFEERVRQIVREEMEAEWLEIKGYADQTREMAFNTCRGIIETICKATINSFGPGGASNAGPKGPQ